MSSPQQLRSGSMFLMIATMICGVLAVLILLPSFDRVTGFKLPSKPSPQTPEALVASEKLSRVYTEFRGTEIPGQQNSRASIHEASAAGSNSTVIARTAHSSERTVSEAASSQPSYSQQYDQIEGKREGQHVPESPQVYVPVTVHPVTVNIDNGSLTAEVSRLTTAMERLAMAPEQRRASETDSQTQAEILAIRQRLDEINSTLANLRISGEQSKPAPVSSEPVSISEAPAHFGDSIDEKPASLADEDVPLSDKGEPTFNPFAEMVNEMESNAEASPNLDEPEAEMPSLPTLDEPIELIEPTEIIEPTEPTEIIKPTEPAEEPEQPEQSPLDVFPESDEIPEPEEPSDDESVPELTIPVQVYEDQSLRTDVPLPTIPVSMPQHIQNLELEIPVEAEVPVELIADTTTEDHSSPELPYPPAETEFVQSSPEPEYELPPLMVPEEEMRQYPHSRPAPSSKSLLSQGFELPQGLNYDMMDLPTPKLPKFSKLQMPKLQMPKIRGPRLPNWEMLTNPDPDVPQWVDQLRDVDPLAPVRESPSLHRGLSALRFAGSSRTVK